MNKQSRQKRISRTRDSVNAWLFESLEDRTLFSVNTGAVALPATTGAPAVSAPLLNASSVATGLDVTFGSNGLAHIKYNGVTLVNLTDPNGNWDDSLHIRSLSIMQPDGTLIPSPQQIRLWDAKTQTMSWTTTLYVFKAKYTLLSNELDMDFTLTNLSKNDTITGFSVEPMKMHFPVMPAGFSATPQVSFGNTAPPVVVADFGKGAVAIANKDVKDRAYSGFYSDNTTQTSNTFWLWFGTQPMAFQPTSWPVFSGAPIKPGASATSGISLRFGASGSTAAQLAPDIYKAFAASQPAQVTWTDRRPIGQLILAAAQADSKTNPRGWLNDPNVNVLTPQGLASFRTRLLAYADSSVAVLKAMNAQGAITWDIEGDFAPYAGDPRQATTLAPELNYQNVVDAYFKKFTDAGLKVGVTIRETNFMVSGGKASQNPVTDPAALLISKIDYAKSRWGASIFYIDSNGALEDPMILRTVQAAEPRVLLVPEHSSAATYASSAPYGEVRGGFVGTTAATRQAYPNAFSVINVEDTALSAATQATLLQSVENGDILLFHGWFNDGSNPIVKQIYQKAAAAAAKPKTNAAVAAYQALPVTTPFMKICGGSATNLIASIASPALA